MAIAHRHVRHDWQTFVEWDQKSVRTLCGVTSQKHLTGIPGITEQPEIIQTGGRALWGWCPRCVYTQREGMMYLPVDVTRIDSDVAKLYIRTQGATDQQWQWMKERGLRGGKKAEEAT